MENGFLNQVQEFNNNSFIRMGKNKDPDGTK